MGSSRNWKWFYIIFHWILNLILLFLVCVFFFFLFFLCYLFDLLFMKQVAISCCCRLHWRHWNCKNVSNNFVISLCFFLFPRFYDSINVSWSQKVNQSFTFINLERIVYAFSNLPLLFSLFFNFIFIYFRLFAEDRFLGANG